MFAVPVREISSVTCLKRYLFLGFLTRSRVLPVLRVRSRGPLFQGCICPTVCLFKRVSALGRPGGSSG